MPWKDLQDKDKFWGQNDATMEISIFPPPPPPPPKKKKK